MAGSHYQKKDRFHQRAKREAFAARSVYKLEELDRRFGLVQRGDRVVDLGAAPGSWMQYLAQKVGKKGAVVGYDLVEPTVGAGLNARTFVADVHELTPERIRSDLFALVAEREGRPPAAGPIPPSFGPHVFVSDMAPKLTGIRDADQAKSVELARIALGLAQALLPVEAGRFAAKLFQGRDTDAYVSELKGVFRNVKLIKPEATREKSREVFVVARELRKPKPSSRHDTGRLG